MAEELSFEDAIKGASATPSGEMSFEDAVQGTSSPSATPSATPRTDRALAETTGGLDRFLKAPSPAWLRRFEDPTRRFLGTPARPSAADIQAGARWLGFPDQPGFGAGQAAGFYERARQIATPANAIITGAMAAQPETIPYLAPPMIAQIAGQVPGELKRVFTGQATPEEAAGAAADVAMLAAPAAHFAIPRAPYAPLPTGHIAELSPVQWRKRYGVPGPPVPPLGTEFYDPGERGFVGIPEPAEESVGEPIPQGGETDASRVAGAEEMGVRGEGGGVGAEAPLRQPGETAAPGEQPGPTGQAVAAQVPAGEHAPGVRGPDVVSPTRAKEPEEMTAEELRSYLAQEYWDKQSLAPTNLVRLLKQKEEAPPGPTPEEPGVVPGEINKQPLSELLSPEDQAEHQRLQTEWTDLDFTLGQAAKIGDRGTVASIADRQRVIKARMREIESKLPDSDIYDGIVIGGGAAGQAAAVSGAGEGLRMKILDIKETGGASGKTPLYENVTGVVAQPGRERAFAGRLAAERMGAEFERVSDLAGPPEYDPRTKLWTVKTVGPGKGGAGGATYLTRTIIGATGTRGRGAPFPIQDASGQPLTRSLFDRSPGAQKLPVTGTAADASGVKVWLADGISMGHEAAGGDMAAIGGANSAGQGAIDAALMNMEKFMPEGARGVIKRPPGGGVVNLIVRGAKPEMSAPLLHKLYRLVDLGWIKIHPFQETTHVEVGPGGEKTLVMQRLAPNPQPGGRPIRTGELTRLPVKSIGSFVGGEPVSGWLPENYARDAEGFAVTDNQLRPLDKTTGQPIDQGIYLAGSMRSGVVNKELPLTARGATAPAVNRMVPSEGEGSTASVAIGSHVTGLEREGMLPRWQQDMREFFNRVEHHGEMAPGPLPTESFATEYPGTDQKAKEVGPRKAYRLEGGKLTPLPSTPRAPSAKTAAELAEHTGGILSPQQQQQQEQERQGLPVVRFPGGEPQTGPPISPATGLLIDRQLTNPKPLTDNDRAMLDQHQDQLRMQYEGIANDQLNAYAEGDQERIAENDQKLSETLDRFTELNNARRKAGEPELPHPPEQFTVESMVKAKRAVNKGRELTPFEMNDVVRWSNMIKEKRDALDAYRAGPESRGYWEEIKKRAEAYRTGDGPKKSLLPDPTNLKLQADLVRAQKDWESSLEKDRKDGLKWYEKAPDYLLKWRRAFAISSPRSLAKLGAAALEGMFLLPSRELVGSALKHMPLVSEVASRAPREGQGFNIRAESEAITETFKNLISDVGKNIRGQKPDYEMVFGKVDQLPPELQNYVGYLHGALKSPLARDEFTRAFQTVAEFEARHGSDLTDPLVQMHIGQKAMESSVFWRLQNKNMATRIYRQVNASLERQGDIGKAASVALQAEFPIVTVPSNFLARTFEGVFGAEKGMVELGRAYGRGIETLKPQEADLIMRNLKTGSLGTALMLLGVFAPQYFGGYYRPGGKKGQQDPGSPKYGETRIGDYDVPSYIQDNPFVALPQFGATTTQVSNMFLRKRDEDPAGIWMGLWSSVYGAASSQPFVRESIDIAKAGDPRTAGDVIGDHARSYLIPQLVQWVASETDPSQTRYPRGVAQRLMMGVPGLREAVPDVVPPPQQLGVRRRGYLPRRPGTTVRVRK